MPSKAITKPSVGQAKKVPTVNLEDEEDIHRVPDSDSSSEDDKRFSRDIKPTVFGSSKATKAASANARRKNTINGRSLKDGNSRRIGTTRPPRRGKESPSSSASTVSPKRKSQEDPMELGAGMKDEFGFTNAKAKKKLKKFGSSQSRLSSSQFQAPKIESGLSRMFLGRR